MKGKRGPFSITSVVRSSTWIPQNSFDPCSCPKKMQLHVLNRLKKWGILLILVLFVLKRFSCMFDLDLKMRRPFDPGICPKKVQLQDWFGLKNRSKSKIAEIVNWGMPVYLIHNRSYPNVEPWPCTTVGQKRPWKEGGGHFSYWAGGM